MVPSLSSAAVSYRQKNTELAARSAVIRQQAQAKLDETHPSLLRTSMRWIGRTKGLPYSRCLLKNFTPCVLGQQGKPAKITLKHPTKGRTFTKVCTPQLLQLFFPALPPNLASAMLGY